MLDSQTLLKNPTTVVGLQPPFPALWYSGTHVSLSVSLQTKLPPPQVNLNLDSCT